MTILFAALEKSLLVLESSSNGDDDSKWKVNEDLKGLHPTAIAIDPQKNSNRVYCETWNNGLWKTDNSGQTWEKTSLMIYMPISQLFQLVQLKKEKKDLTNCLLELNLV